ncbi:hypothetical protein GCM10023321_01730 [Pseudonocardia eucalypti]|uniref:Uncharacterized protein n=1 Tax=Pseudonocardia eucalypti TaxID=648755 RepID=A0ABP9PEE0_9PSEU
MLAPRSADIRASATFTLVVFSTDMNIPITITPRGSNHPASPASRGFVLGESGLEVRSVGFSGAMGGVSSVEVLAEAAMITRSS